MLDGWIWADGEILPSPMEFAWGDEDDDQEWEGSLDWGEEDDEEDDLDEDWDDEDEEDDEEWEEWEDKFEEEDEDSIARRRSRRHEWN